MRLTLSLCVLSLLPTGCVRSSAAADPARSTPASSGPGTVLITGSNRGIGLEFARQYAAMGWSVIATARNPESADDLRTLAAKHSDVTIERLDVTDHTGIDALAKKYEGRPIDVLINNAGIRGAREKQVLGNLDHDLFEQMMSVNVYGPLRIAQAFLANVAASKQKKIVAISSQSGSLTGARSGYGVMFFYRISKASLNMAMISLHANSKDRGILVGIISPGPGVDTRMFRMDDNKRPAMEPAESVAGMIKVIDSLNEKNSATFVQWDGKKLAW